MSKSLKAASGLVAGVLITCLLYAVAVASVVLYVDPVQVFHGRTSNADDYFFKEQVLQTPATIRQHFIRGGDGKVAVLGASMGWKIMPEDIRDILGWEGAYNLSSGGNGPAAVREQLELLFTGKSLKTAICLVEGTYYFHNPPNMLPAKDNIPYLFHRDPLSAAQYLLNKQMFFNSLFLAFGIGDASGFTRFPNEESLLQMQKSSRAGQYSRRTTPKMVERLLAARELWRESAARAHDAVLHDLKTGYRSGTDLTNVSMMADIVLEHPDIEFILFVPPTTTTWQAEKGDRFEFCYNYYFGLELLVEKLRPAKNVRIFAFDDVSKIVENMANYRDSWHFGIGVSRYFLHSVREDEHRIDASNIDAYLERVFRLWMQGNAYCDVQDTVAFEGRMDEDVYSEYPYPKSKYAQPAK